MLRVHISHSPSNEIRCHLEGLLDENILLSYGAQIPDLPDYAILVNGRPSREDLSASPHLETLIIPFAGLPESTRELLREFPTLEVQNLHYNAAATAEMAIALLMAAAKCLIPIDRAFRKLDWSARYERHPSVLLEGQTALVLGYGAIGWRVCQGCIALGMNVLAMRRSICKAYKEEGVAVFPFQALEELLPRANALIISLPDTPETRRMIDAKALKRLPPNAILVNIARGAIVDEQALYQALLDRNLFAAGLDVWYQYPQDDSEWLGKAPSRFPFHELDNVVMSPHRAGSWERSEYLRMEHLAQLLNQAGRGEPLIHRVDPVRGY